MKKFEFISKLREKLSGLPKKEVEERLIFYGEMIDDKMEEGTLEEDAVASVGRIDDIVEQITAEIPFFKIVQEKIKPKRKIQAWEILLLVLGSPIWLSLLIVAFAVSVSLYAVLCSLVISLWAVFASLVGCGVGGVLACLVISFTGNVASGLFLLGAGLICAGLSVFVFFVCKAITDLLISHAKNFVKTLKNRLMKKERVS